MIQPNNLNASKLKTYFAVFGHFYTLNIANNSYPCRSILELIAHTKIPSDPNQIQHLKPDLLVIMMNPGSSQPLNHDYQPQTITQIATLLESCELVPTRPDNTQYQIMRIMVALGYQHARVLNLSDLREPKSPIFVNKINQLSLQKGGGDHSLFCPSRTDQRERLMGKVGRVPVLVGWGRNLGLMGLAKQCLKTLHGWQKVGVSVDKENILYAHPSPMLQRMKEQWLDQVLNQLTHRSG